MDVIQQEFDKLEGQSIHSFTIQNDQGMRIKCINYGCIITDITSPDSNGVYENVVLGFDTIDEYIKYSPYFGAVVGRVAGRIKGGAFELNGLEYCVTKNERSNHLHGGKKGFSHVLWNAAIIRDEDTVGVEFSYVSPNREEGYPGTVRVSVTYTLNNNNEMLISYSGISDETTLLNLTNHTYFNLSGNLKRDILEHTLTLKSDTFLELNEELLPTGAMLNVEGTSFDFRKGRKIVDGIKSDHAQNVIAGRGYDHPFLLGSHFQQEIVLKEEEACRKLIIETDQPSVVFYSGNQLEDHYSIREEQSRKYLGLCLETQGLPDAIHHANFPSIVLEKGIEYRATTKYTCTTL